MIDELKIILDYIEEKLDVESIRKREQRQLKAIRFQPLDAPVASVDFPIKSFTGFSMEEIHESIEKMMYNELIGVLPAIEIESDRLPMIRANYGVGILPSAFGLKNRIIDGNMPWVDCVGKDGVKKLLSKGVPDFTDGTSARIIDTYAFYGEVFKSYPKCREAIRIYQPDYQGPFDVADLIYGTEIFMDMYDEPELVHDLIALALEAYIVGMNKIKPYLNDKIEDCIAQWQLLFPGNILLRNDSAVNVSAVMYDEFICPYDERLLKAFGGGSMHFCGRADQWIFNMAKCDGIRGFNFGHMDKLQFGQQYLDFLKKDFFDEQKPIIGYVLKKHELDEFDFNKYRTGVTYSVSANDKDDAKRIINEYFRK